MHDQTEVLGISLRFKEREVYVPSPEPDRFVHFFSGEVLKMDRDLEDAVVGWFEAIYVDVETAIVEGESIFDMFDCHQVTYGYYQTLFDPETDEPRKEVLDLIYGKFMAEWAPNLLILDRLEILPAYRGRGVGLVALWGLMRVLGLGAGIVALTPFPLQAHGRPSSEDEAARWDALQLDAMPTDLRRATAGLRRYYRRLGFKSLRGTDCMVRDARAKLPSLAKLLQTK